EARPLRARLRPLLDPVAWPASFYEVPRLAFPIAAALGMHDEMRAVVESWKDDRYGGELWVDHYHRPQEIVFGLGDARLVEFHMRRLRLRLWEPLYLRAWLAHTEVAALDYVRDCLVALTNRDEAEKLIPELGRAKAPETAVVMLD